MTCPFQRIGTARSIQLAVLAASIGALGFAYTAEIGFDYEPCTLCLYQRAPYAAAAVLALLALAGPRSGRVPAIVATLCGTIFLVGAAIAVYHVGVEQHWWASAVCTGSGPAALSFEQMQQSLLHGEPKACDTVDWQLFGISMAGYNIVYSLLLATGCFAGARILRTES